MDRLFVSYYLTNLNTSSQEIEQSNVDSLRLKR